MGYNCEILNLIGFLLVLSFCGKYVDVMYDVFYSYDLWVLLVYLVKFFL